MPSINQSARSSLLKNQRKSLLKSSIVTIDIGKDENIKKRKSEPLNQGGKRRKVDESKAIVSKKANNEASRPLKQNSQEKKKHDKNNKFSLMDAQVMTADQFIDQEVDSDASENEFDESKAYNFEDEMQNDGAEDEEPTYEQKSDENSDKDSNDEDSNDEQTDSYEAQISRMRTQSNKKKSMESSDDDSMSDESSEDEAPKKKREHGVDIDKYRMKVSGAIEEDISDDDDEFDTNLLGDESDEENENDPLAQMIESSRQMDIEKKKQETEAEQELESMALSQAETTLLKDVEEYKSQNVENTSTLFAAEDISQIYSRIVENLRVLCNFKKAKEEGYTRNDYLELLKEDLCKYYGYLPDLVDKFATMFSPPELVELMEANEAPRPVVLRTNPLKARRREVAEALIKRGVNLDPLDRWSNLGLKVNDTEVPVGATPEYLAGWYMIQGASSFLPVIALSPEPGDVVVDMASAPGGKTTYMSALMKNTGVIYANDPEKKRTKGLTANIHRLGVRNAIVCNYDGRDLPKVVHPRADKILLDAPCSGTGVVSRDPSVKSTRDNKDIQNMSRLQKELLLAAIDTAKDPRKSNKPVYIVYSTCSITPEENEEVVNYVLRKRFVKVVDTGLPKKLGKPGFKKVHDKRFDPSLELTRRIYPHAHNMDGFFVCKLQKIQDGPQNEEERIYKDELRQSQLEERRAQKEENRRIQKKREEHNKKLLKVALDRYGGNEEAARQWMKERKHRILDDPDYKVIRPKRSKSDLR